MDGVERWRSHAARRCSVRSAPPTPSRRPSSGCSRRSGSASWPPASGSRPSATSRPGWGSVASASARALAALVEAGYLELRRGRYGGTFVRSAEPGPQTPAHPPTPLDPAELVDTLTFRHAVETGAAEAAASCALGPAEHAHLRGLLAGTRDASPADYRRLDSRLHLAIAEVTGSPSLTAAVAEVRLRTNDLLDAIPLLRPNIDHSDRQHRQLVDADPRR